MSRPDRNEFDRQVGNLIQAGYPAFVGLDEEAFKEQLAPLRQRVQSLPMPEEIEPRQGHVPYIIVVRSDGVAGDKAMEQVERQGKRGFSIMEAEEIRRFQPIEGVELPAGIAYVAADIDRGMETLNATPNEALKTIAQQGRSPLTIEEGIALLTHYPDMLQKNNGFSLLASRCGDRRVTALWISGGRPKLGWCWAGNPHTWLGSASCGRRIGG
ncbi:DUF5701 family protein [Paenibacillus thiaminolyticus]|uniref:DUF5701 family protein n=1 Tax=Paenibacillus thiaminolyticus TaxID=49283 RepID=UPI003D2B2089